MRIWIDRPLGYISLQVINTTASAAKRVTSFTYSLFQQSCLSMFIAILFGVMFLS